MQNQSQTYCKVRYDPQVLCDSFPITIPDSSLYSPPSGPVSYMHYHDCLEIGYCYSGYGIFFVDGNVQPFSAGDASIIFHNQIHIAQSDTRHSSEWKFVSLDPYRLLSDFCLSDFARLSRILERARLNKNIFEENHASGIPKLIFDIITELESQKENYTMMVKTMLYQLLLKLSRENPEGSENMLPMSSHGIGRISSALIYISENYANQFSIHILADICNMSLTHFRRVFKSIMGMAPTEYLHLVRIKMASILLLNTNSSILEISLNVGYPTLSSFNRKFLCIIGTSPREWRKKGYKSQTL